MKKNNMALFNPKAKKDEAAPEAAAPVRAAKKANAKAVAPIASAAAHALIGARITEKASELSARNVYAFNVKVTANKRTVSEAIHALYKVTPVAVRIVQVPSKAVRHSKLGIVGTRPKQKKAYVELAEGDTISLM